MFDQTARMFQQFSKGTIVYDVMDSSKSPKVNDGYLKFNQERCYSTLDLKVEIYNWQSKFPSMNTTCSLNLISILSQENTTKYLKLIQWFYFSVKRMMTNTAYKFNILNLSKPASQFNNGMQPVMYSVEDPGWKRVGDYVFYIK